MSEAREHSRGELSVTQPEPDVMVFYNRPSQAALVTAGLALVACAVGAICLVATLRGSWRWSAVVPCVFGMFVVLVLSHSVRHVVDRARGTVERVSYWLCWLPLRSHYTLPAEGPWTRVDERKDQSRAGGLVYAAVLRIDHWSGVVQLGPWRRVEEEAERDARIAEWFLDHDDSPRPVG